MGCGSRGMVRRIVRARLGGDSDLFCKIASHSTESRPDRSSPAIKMIQHIGDQIDAALSLHGRTSYRPWSG